MGDRGSMPTNSFEYSTGEYGLRPLFLTILDLKAQEPVPTADRAGDAPADTVQEYKGVIPAAKGWGAIPITWKTEVSVAPIFSDVRAAR